MITFAKFFTILFLSVKISRERLKDLAEDHILRLTENNPGGIFTGILTNITNAYNAYFGSYSSAGVNLAVQEGKTIGMNKSRVALEKNISDNEKLIAYTYKDALETYQEFYPLGVTEYLNADLSTLETISLRYKTVLASHSADFTATFVSDYNTVQGTYVTNRGAQTTAKSKVSSSKSGIKSSKLTLAKQLTVNLLTIAIQFIGDESQANVYFNQAIINAAFKESASKVSNDIDPTETDNVFDNTEGPNTKYKITVSGEGALFVGFAPDEATAITATTGKTIDNTATLIFTAAELGFTSTDFYLNITNSAAITLSYIIERV